MDHRPDMTAFACHFEPIVGPTVDRAVSEFASIRGEIVDNTRRLAALEHQMVELHLEMRGFIEWLEAREQTVSQPEEGA